MQPSDRPHHGCPVLGRWEWVALPEFGIACIRARLDADRAVSTLHAADVAATEVDGEPHLRFRVYPLADDPQTFVVVEALRGPAADPHARTSGTRPVILTLLTVGDESFQVALEVIEAPPGGPSLTLGRDVLDDRFAVDPGRRELAGPPRLDWQPRQRSRCRSA